MPLDTYAGTCIIVVTVDVVEKIYLHKYLIIDVSIAIALFTTSIVYVSLTSTFPAYLSVTKLVAATVYISFTTNTTKINVSITVAVSVITHITNICS